MDQKLGMFSFIISYLNFKKYVKSKLKIPFIKSSSLSYSDLKPMSFILS